MEKDETVKKAEQLVKREMQRNDSSHDFLHAFRVRDMALSLATDEGFLSSPRSILVVELAALLHDIGDHKYVRGDSEKTMTVEKFLIEEGLHQSVREDILKIIERIGFKDELTQSGNVILPSEFGVVQDADRLDAMGAIGIARCFTFGGSRNHVIHDPEVHPRSNLSKEEYMKGMKNPTAINHFHEKLLKLKDLMKTEAGKRRAERRHKFMLGFLEEFYQEWDMRA